MVVTRRSSSRCDVYEFTTLTAVSAPGLILQAFRGRQLALRVLHPSDLLVELPEQVMRRPIVRIVLNGPRQHSFGRGGLALLHIGATEDDVRSAVVRVEPD